MRACMCCRVSPHAAPFFNLFLCGTGPHEREPDYDGVKIVFCGDPQQMGTKQRPKKNQKKSKSGKSLGKVPTLQEFVNNIVQEPDESFQAVLLTKRDIKRGGGRAIKAVYARFEKIGL